MLFSDFTSVLMLLEEQSLGSGIDKTVEELCLYIGKHEVYNMGQKKKAPPINFTTSCILAVI